MFPDYLSRARTLAEAQSFTDRDWQRLSINTEPDNVDLPVSRGYASITQTSSHTGDHDVFYLHDTQSFHPLLSLLQDGRSLVDAYLADSNVAKTYRQCQDGTGSSEWFLASDDTLYKLNFGRTRIVVPEELINPLITSVHIGLRHQGPTRVVATMGQQYWFRNMPGRIDKCLLSCSCYRNRTIKTPFLNNRPNPPDVPPGPLHVVSFDHMSGLPEVEYRGRTYNAVWIVSDCFSKYTYYIPSATSRESSELVQAYIRNILPHDGVPRKFVSDNASVYVSSFVRDLLAELGIDHGTSVTYYPQGHGHAEAAVKILREMFRALPSRTAWFQYLPFLQLARNTTVHSVTGFTPQRLHRARDITLPGFTSAVDPMALPGSVTHLKDWCADLDRARQALSAARMALAHEISSSRSVDVSNRSPVSHTLPRQRFQVGQSVLVRRNVFGTHDDKFSPLLVGPYKVTRVGSGTCHCVPLFGPHVQHGHSKLPTKRFWIWRHRDLRPYGIYDAYLSDDPVSPITGQTVNAHQLSSSIASASKTVPPTTAPSINDGPVLGALPGVGIETLVGPVVKHDGLVHNVVKILERKSIRQHVHFRIETPAGEHFWIPTKCFTTPPSRRIKNAFNNRLRVESTE